MNKIGLYVHIPFCLSKCPYCDFYSVRYSREKAAEYAEAVIRNIRCSGNEYDTVYFGGGTPVLLYEHIGKILAAADICSGAEITVEANPCIASEDVLRILKESGVNRISFGVQSMNENELKFLGRRHTNGQTRNAVNNALKCGIENISADLMLGLENQDEKSVGSSIDELHSLGVKHISAYLLKIEENTPFAERRLSLPDEDRTAALYLYAVDKLAECGYRQYEISNFAVNGYESRHNLKYWRCEEYLGIGAAAHSYIGGKRFCVPRSIDSFINAQVQETEFTDDEAGGFEEYAMLRLRLTDGLYFSEAEKFGTAKETLLKRCRLLPEEYINVTDEKINLTPKGFLLSNAVIGKLIGY